MTMEIDLTPPQAEQMELYRLHKQLQRWQIVGEYIERVIRPYLGLGDDDPLPDLTTLPAIADDDVAYLALAYGLLVQHKS